MLEIYSKGGFIGPIRPDHAPALVGESKDGKSTGYTIAGKAFTFGYIKGIMDSFGLRYAFITRPACGAAPPETHPALPRIRHRRGRSHWILQDLRSICYAV